MTSVSVKLKGQESKLIIISSLKEGEQPIKIAINQINPQMLQIVKISINFKIIRITIKI